MTEPTRSHWLQIGQVVGVFGVRGEVRIKSFSDHPDLALQLPHWWLGSDPSALRQVTVVGGRRHGVGLVAKLAGWDSPEAAIALIKQKVWAPRDSFPEPEEDTYYWEDLTGCRVVEEETGDEIGIVRGLFATGANDVLVVGKVGEREERLLPFIKDVVIEVDMEQRRLVARLLPGL